MVESERQEGSEGQDTAFENLLSRFEELKQGVQADTAAAMEKLASKDARLSHMERVARFDVADTHMDARTVIVSTAAAGGHHEWRIENFSKLTSEPVWSDGFEAGIGTWYLEVHPKGYDGSTHMQVYLELQDGMWQPSAKVNLTLNNKADLSASVLKGSLIKLSELMDADAGWLVNDTLMLMVDGTVEHEDRFQLGTGGVPCDVALKLQCGAEVPSISQFLRAASPFFRGILEDVKRSDLIPRLSPRSPSGALVCR
ncbi:hypothetical protein FOA52_015275 [Chlamydomonas sp. UWO 241]|nr:hypothetical protein FOA52_015275 [Chlamydomonas sp. UWO 241]